MVFTASATRKTALQCALDHDQPACSYGAEACEPAETNWECRPTDEGRQLLFPPPQGKRLFKVDVFQGWFKP